MNRKTRALIESIADVVTGYITFQARCGLSLVYSEYLLYEPILRVARHLNWNVRFEAELQKLQGGPGDCERIDFIFWPEDDTKRESQVGLEVKWPRDRDASLKINNDISKLWRYRDKEGRELKERFVLIAGSHRKSQTAPGPHDYEPITKKIDKYFSKKTLTRVLVSHGHNWGATIYSLNDLQKNIIQSLGCNSPARKRR